VRVSDLRVNYRLDPIGLDDRAPRFTWTVDSDRRGDTQSAYQLRVVGSGSGGVVWETGRVPSAALHAGYEGPALASRQRLSWQVQVWDAEGVASDWSSAATFEMGLLDEEDWQARWIAPPPAQLEAADDVEGIDRGEWRGNRPALLRRPFDCEADIVAARVYVSARGLYELRLNGEKVGDDLLTPGWSDYRFRLPYQAYDVTTQLRAGSNVLGAVLVDGWYSGRLGWLDRIYGETPSFVAQLHLERADGSQAVIASEGEWMTSPSSRLWADLVMGEVRDLGATQPGWDAPGFDDSDWVAVDLADAPDAVLENHDGSPVRVLDEQVARSVIETTPGTFIADLGQNMVGWARLSVEGRAGDLVRVRHAEMLDEAGGLYVANLRTALATDAYLLSEDGAAVLEPRFTFHGFRFVEVSGLAPGATPDVTGVVIGSATPEIGTFECSLPLVNQLQRNIQWGRRGNFLEAPTDCPQRDERLGWMGDAQIFVGTACWNADVAPFFTKWLRDVVDGRDELGAFPDVAPVIAPDFLGHAAPAWGDAGVIVPWVLYQRYGDERFLERAFDSMMSWVDSVAADNPDGLWLHGRHNDYGDWLSVNSDTPREVLATAYFFHSADLVCRVGEIIGRKEEADRYRQLADHIREAFEAAYLTGSGRIVGHTQTTYVLALAFGLVPDHLRPAAAQHLEAQIRDRRGLGSKFRPGHLDTGFLGVGHLLPTLTAHDRLELAYRLLENDDFPSWGYSIKHGATTIWERWDGWTAENGFQTPAMNSFNHYSLGSVGDWLYTTVAGISPAAPGFERIRIRPRPGGSITSAAATHRSVRGEIASSWVVEDGRLRLSVVIPANTSAEVWFPGTTASSLSEGGRDVADADGVNPMGDRDGCTVVEIGGGRYEFESTYQPPAGR
jgi:alpha-L-rhamnosidase